MNIEEARAKLQSVKTPEPIISSRSNFSSRNREFLHVSPQEQAVIDEANKYMTKYELISKGWKFKLSNSKRGMGLCDYDIKTISFSRNYVHIKQSEITDTILHEIAHALAAIRHGDYGHGPTWRSVCIELGCRPRSQCHDEEVVSAAPYRYKLIAPCCDKEWKYYRKPRLHPSRYHCPTHGNQLIIEVVD